MAFFDNTHLIKLLVVLAIICYAEAKCCTSYSGDMNLTRHEDKCFASCIHRDPQYTHAYFRWTIATTHEDSYDVSIGYAPLNSTGCSDFQVVESFDYKNAPSEGDKTVPISGVGELADFQISCHNLIRHCEIEYFVEVCSLP